MKKPVKFTLLTAFILSGLFVNAQITLNSPSNNFTICPNQPATIIATWNNVSNITYTLFAPPAAGSTVVSSQFTLTNPNVSSLPFTLIGSGISINGPVTSTVNFNVTAFAPPALSITNTVNYCHGDNAVLQAPSGATVYNVAGGCSGGQPFSSNVITIPNVNQGCSGTYTVSATINGCARTGTTSVQVAPNSQITITSPTAQCEGLNVILTATLPGAPGGSYQWLDNSNNPVGGGSATLNLNNVVPNQSGKYTVNSYILFVGNINYPSVQCPRTATTNVTVVSTVAVVASASPSNIVCQGGNLNLNANAGSNVSGFQWSGPNSFFSLTQNPNINLVSPANNGSYSVTALFLGPGVTCTSGAVISVQVVPVTQPVITMSPSICEGASVTMTASAGPGAQITWFGPCVQNSIGISATVYTAPTNCSGTYFATAKYSISGVNCAATASSVLYVVPVSSITVIPPNPVCTPDNALLQASANGANLFQWVGPNNFSSPGPNVTVYYPPIAASGIYTVTAYFGGGNITCLNTNTVELKVNPVLNFTLEPRTQVCYNTNVSVQGPAGATSYAWTSSTGFTSSDKDLNLPLVMPKNTGGYTLTVALGPCITKQETWVEVLDPITFTLTPESKTICRGDTLVLEAGVIGGSQNYAYVWNPALYMDSPNGPLKWLIPQTTVMYNLIVHDIACPNYTIGKAVDITVNQPPQPDLELKRNYGCTPFVQFYDTKIPPGTAIVTYDFGGLMQYQQDAKNYTLTTPGVYTLKVHTKDRITGCGGTFTYPDPITVDPGPGSDFILSPEVPTTADDVQFIPSNSYEPVIRYSWEFLGGVDLLDTSALKYTKTGSDLSELKTPVRSYNKAGIYPVMLITENDKGCIDTVFKAIKVIDDMQVYIPNSFTPNGDGINDLFFVKGMGIKLENFNIQIVDRWGNIVFETKDINQGWDGMVRGAPARDGTYTCFVKAVGMNGEGRRAYTSNLTIIK